MKCCNCQTEIPPSFKRALVINQCPACGDKIMNDSMQELLSELKEALARMPNDPEGLAGWLLSNYQLIKIGTGEPVQEFFGQKKTITQEVNKSNSNRVQEFFKNAGIKKQDKDYKSIVDEIKTGKFELDEESVEVSEDENESYEDDLIKEDVKKTSLDLSINPKLQADRFSRLEKQQAISFGETVGKIKRSE
jgi:hypothetical protein